MEGAATGRRGVCAAQHACAVASVLSNPAVTAPIVGASRPEQLADSLAAAAMNGLPPDLRTRLDEMTIGWRAVDAER
jgi:1-deoxyxylulose-5-phosphate synthase